MTDSPTRRLKVFLCHASADKPAVRKLYRFLRQRRMDPWLDSEKILPGENWEVEIPKAIFDSDVILVCLSKNSVNKEGYVQKEIVFALDKAMEKPEGTIFIIPAKLEECDVPQRLNRYQWVDLYRDGYKRLMLSLNKRASQLGLDIEQVTVLNSIKRAERERIEKVAVAKADLEMLEEALNGNTEHFAANKVSLEVEEAPIEEKPKADEQISDEEYVEQSDISSRQVAEKDDLDSVQYFPLSESAEEKEEDKQEIPVVSLHESSSPIESLPQETGINKNESTQSSDPPIKRKLISNPKLRLFIGVASVIIFMPLCIMIGVNYSTKNLFEFVTVTVTSSPPNAISTTPASQPTTTDTPAPTQTSLPPTPTLGIGSTITSDKDGMTLLYVPAGEFTMGSDSGDDDEKPVHKVNLDAFWIDKTEVTNAMFAKFLNEVTPQLSVENNELVKLSGYVYYNLTCTDCPNWVRIKWDGGDFTVVPVYENHPVVLTTWYGASAYCSWADRRLPTEAEWEKAARGTDGRTYPWGNDAPNNNLLNYNSAVGDTTQVGKYPDGKSIYGALDMAGNVWEWVADWYSDTYYASSPPSNPLGPDSGQYRVLRGGSWNFFDSDVRSAVRLRVDPSSTYFSFGFRCSRSP